MLVGRTAELSLLDRVVGSPQGRSLLVEGAPGTGRTAMATETIVRARTAGLDVLAARADADEADLPFGVVRQLFERAVLSLPPADQDALFVGPAVLARPLFTPEAVVAAATGEPVAVTPPVLHGLYWLVTQLGERTPLVVVVDDLQWADGPSLRWLAYLLGRLNGLPVSLVATLRVGVGVAEGLVGAALGKFDNSVTLVELGSQQIEVLVRAVLDHEPDPLFVDECQRVTGGNPLLLTALLTECRINGVLPTAADTPRIAQFGPREAMRLVRETIQHGGARVSLVVNALAVLGDDATPATLAAVTGMGAQELGDRLHWLERAGITRRCDDGAVLLRHAILRSAVANNMPSTTHRTLRLTVAEVLRQHGADIERVAGHLLEVGPIGVGWAHAALVEAADVAESHGASQRAVSYLHGALREHNDDAERAALLMRLGRVQAGISLRGAVRDLESGLSLAADPAVAPDPAARVEAALELSTALFVRDQPADGLRSLRQAVDSLLATDGQADVRLELEQLHAAMVLPAEVATAWPKLLALSPQEGLGVAAGSLLSATLAYRELCAGGSWQQAAALAKASLDTARPDQERFSHAHTSALMVLIATGDAEYGRRYCTRMAEHFERAGPKLLRATSRTFRAVFELQMGAVQQALTNVQTVVAYRPASVSIERSVSSAVPLGLLVTALLEDDRAEEAAALLVRHDATGPLPDALLACWTLLARGRLRLAEGQYRAAITDLAECGRRAAGCRIDNPAVLPWREPVVRAHLGLGDRAAALRVAEENLELAKAWGAPTAVGPALRCSALTADRDDAVNLLRRSVELLTGTEVRLELICSNLELGRALRTAGRLEPARAALRDAADLAVTCGATLLNRQALEELRATGVRPRTRSFTGVTSLTPSERRIAELAAAGVSNQDIARQLFVGLRTVEVHLTNSYRKLGVQGRAQLAEAMATVAPATGTDRNISVGRPNT